MELQDDQFDQVALLVNRSVSMHSLRIELLDHMCCHIEQQLDRGVPFEKALEEALLQLSPEGLAVVEEKTIFLLTFKKELTMKKFLYSTGFLAAFFTLTGFVFRTMKWPGGSAMMFLGSLFLCISMVFILIIAKRNYTSIQGKARLRSLSGAIGGIIAASGIMSKILHLPGANILFIIGAAILISVFLPVLFLQLYKSDIAQSSEAA
ncbi:MAG: hypothetical protein RLZZ543_254 [Bacteroidota bacterium]|jgi:hypothetical protein